MDQVRIICIACFFAKKEKDTINIYYLFRAAIFVREVDILSLTLVLKKISQKRIAELQEQGAWLYEKYFKSMEKITEATLEILADRVFPHLARDYTFWNIPPHKESINRTN